MASYQCTYHDGPQDAVIIHQTLGEPGVISVCRECQPIYLIGALSMARQENPRRLEILLNSVLPPWQQIRFFG